MANANLTNAKKAKNDEFYTQWQDIEKEMSAYLEYNPNVFKGKTILLPCDDPEWSNFTKFFASRFEKFGLKKLISTSYASNSKGYSVGYKPTPFEINNPQYNKDKTITNGKIYTLDHDTTNDGKINLDDLEWHYLEGDGDFNSDEIKELRDEADIIITNPPFSKFRNFLSWIVESNKQFVIIGSMNAITYKEVFPLIKDNKAWLGVTGNTSDMVFAVPKGTEVAEKDKLKAEKLGYVGDYTRLGNSCWYTNLDHGQRHQPLPLMSMEDNLRFNKKIIKEREKGKAPYINYDNYNAIEVSFTNAIPSDYTGVMGVPISFLDKYSPEQFEIVGTSDNGLVDDKFKTTQGLTKQFVDDYYKSGGTGAYKEGNPTAGYYENNIAKMAYKRIFIKHRKVAK